MTLTARFQYFLWRFIVSVWKCVEKWPFSRKQIEINEFYTENRLFLAILTQSYIWQEDSWNFSFLAKMALFCPNKLPRSVSLSGMVFLYSWAGPFWTPESCVMPFFYCGNFFLHTWTIFPHDLSGQLWQQNTIHSKCTKNVLCLFSGSI